MTKLATICYIDNGKDFLLLLRNKKPNDVHEGKYIGVGGKLEAAETPEECAVREILKKQDYRQQDGDERNHHLPRIHPRTRLVYVCFSGDGVFRRAD